MRFMRKRYLIPVVLFALSGCETHHSSQFATDLTPRPRVAAAPSPVPTPVTIASNEVPPPPMGRPSGEDSGLRPIRLRQAPSQQLNPSDRAPVDASPPVQIVQPPQINRSAVTPQEYEYYQHIVRVMGILTRSSSQVSDPNYFNTPGSFEKFKAEVDTAWSENLSFFNVPRKYRLTHQYLSAALTKFKTTVDSIALARALGTSYPKAREDMQAVVALFKLASDEAKRADS